MKLSGVWRAHCADDTLRRDFPLVDFDDANWSEVPVPVIGVQLMNSKMPLDRSFIGHGLS